MYVYREVSVIILMEQKGHSRITLVQPLFIDTLLRGIKIVIIFFFKESFIRFKRLRSPLSKIKEELQKES